MTDRRTFLAGCGGLALRPAHGSVPTRWQPEPEQRSMRRVRVRMRDGTHLDCWDTGGNGETIVLLHPNTGSNAVWGYQQPVLVDAGYRVVAYSRRGAGNSETGPAQAASSAVDDLTDVIDALKVGACHLVGTAAGGFLVPDAALVIPHRLLTLTIACSHAGIVERSWLDGAARLLPSDFRDLPADFRELSGSYRLENPQGQARWIELERAAANKRVSQPPENVVDFAALEKISHPVLIIAGDADPYIPPARARQLAGLFCNAQFRIVPEAGHSVYWERPSEFNSALLDFIRNAPMGDSGFLGLDPA